MSEGEKNTIVNSYNRNFPKRNDGISTTHAFVTSPETTVALALAGTLDFNPLTDTLTNDQGEEITLAVPVGEELPARGSTPARPVSSHLPRTHPTSRSLSAPTPTACSC